MKVLEHFNELYSSELNREILIADTGDFHISHISSKKKLDAVRENICLKKPNYICINGDYIDKPEILEEPILYEYSIEYLKQLSFISPVMMVIGSHEYAGDKGYYNLNENWISDIKSLKNVNLLDNSKCEFDDIRFLGYTTSYDYYSLNSKNKRSFEDENILISEYNSLMPKAGDEMYNVLMCHSPICILNEKVLNSVNDMKLINLILTGHMHNGMLPNFISKMLPNNIGLIAPNKSLFPDNARGIVTKQIDDHEIVMIINGGVTKIQETAPKILHFADNLYNPQIDYIKIKEFKK